MASEAKDAPAARRETIIDAAAGVFLRYGYKKTSMDDLARAADLSRQGLYLHFDTKETLFKAAVLRLVEQSKQVARAFLERDDLELEERILGAFEAIHGQAFTALGSEHMDELLGTAAALIGPMLPAIEQDLVGGVAALLSKSGVARQWKASGLTAKDLAENLHATSVGLKHTVTTKAAYRARLRSALKMLTAGARK